MSKKIVFCADGTWNHPKSPAIVSGADTNVYKLYKSLAVTPSQFTAYDDGVGADGLPLERLIGGAFGVGLFQKIKDGYTAIAHVYEEGDAIYIFGFSRGAYTARSLAGMVAICGLPTRNFNQSFVDAAFNAYRYRDQRETILAGLASFNIFDAKITMLGVWDTVGALGIPGALFDDSEFNYGFLDTSLHPDVQAAYHALSVDERRPEFQPTLWTSSPSDSQIMQQVWFAGVHSDIGGGYSETGLSNIPLSWILNKAIQHGIEALPDAVAIYGEIAPVHSLDFIHESWNILWGFPKKRLLPNHMIPSGATIANSVQIRLLGDVGYHPTNLSIDNSGQLLGYTFETVV